MIRKVVVTIVCVTALCVFRQAASATEPLRVVATIQPLHSLVSGVMNGVGEPDLLVQGGGSPHAYTLRPSEAAALQSADIVFWIGEDLETFLTKPLQALPKHAEVVALYTADGITLLTSRAGPESSTHPGHVHGLSNMHIWLDPANAKAMVVRIVAVLSSADPFNAPRYQVNGAEVINRLTALDADLQRQLLPIRNRPFIVFHDAYQYFESRYGLKSAGSITVGPDRSPSAKKLFEIRKLIIDTGAACVFSEPQFKPAVVQTVIEGTEARTAVLDPLGADLQPAPDAYFVLMRNLAVSLLECLKTER